MWGGVGGERGMKSSEEGESSTAEPKLPSERSAPAARSLAAAAPGSPARPRLLWAPAGGGRRAGAGTINLGRGAARFSRERRTRESLGPRPDGGSGARRAEEASGSRAAAPASARARIFFKRLKLSFFPRVLGSLLNGIALLSPAGRQGAIAPRGSSVAGLTSRTRDPWL